MKVAGALLVLVSLYLLVAGGVPYKKSEEVARIGSLKMQVSEDKHFAVPPIVSGIGILLGAALFFVGSRKPPA
jgi:hypothetical protein